MSGKPVFPPIILMIVLMIVLMTVLGHASAQSAMDWIQKMSDAMRHLSYQGNFVYLHQDQLESMSIFHISNEMGETEKLLSLNGEAREVYRDNNKLVCSWPLSRKVVVDRSRQSRYSPIFIPEEIKRISKFYDMRLVGKDRIAGQSAVLVSIIPKDRFRYGLNFWISSSNGLLLKSNLINEQNQIVEQVMFTNLELMTPQEQARHITPPGIEDNFALIRSHTGEVLDGLEVDMSWRLSNVPAGFWQESALKRKEVDSGQFVQQMVYTDGLATMSVFIEKQLAQGQHLGGTSMGAVNAYVHLLKGYSVTAIGEVPAITVQQVAESASYQKP